jgi:diguanylate cyclase (GGDEF)-like protein
MLFRRREEAPQTTREENSDPEQLLFDSLSGLYQTWYLERRAEEELARCARYGRPLTLVLFEPQLFPGEVLADEVIASAGKAIAAGVRRADLAGRLDETRFAALLIEVDYNLARIVAHRLKVDLGQRARTGGGRWRASLAAFPDDGVDIDALLQVAGRRLTEAEAAAA